MIQTGSDLVVNIIVSESGFAIDGFEFRPIEESTMCEPGMYFNRRDGLYYFDPEFTQREPVTPQQPEQL
jgi:hypothetical protein